MIWGLELFNWKTTTFPAWLPCNQVKSSKSFLHQEFVQEDKAPSLQDLQMDRPDLPTLKTFQSDEQLKQVDIFDDEEIFFMV